jgi:hypothetical protein
MCYSVSQSLDAIFIYLIVVVLHMFYYLFGGFCTEHMFYYLFGGFCTEHMFYYLFDCCCTAHVLLSI